MKPNLNSHGWTPIRLVIKHLPADLNQQELLEKIKPYDVYLQSMDLYPAKIDPKTFTHSQAFLYFQRQDAAINFIEAAKEKKILQFNHESDKPIIIKKAFVQEVCQGWKQNFNDGSYTESVFYKDFMTMLNNEKNMKQVTGIDRKPGEL